MTFDELSKKLKELKGLIDSVNINMSAREYEAIGEHINRIMKLLDTESLEIGGESIIDEFTDYDTIDGYPDDEYPKDDNGF